MSTTLVDTHKGRRGAMERTRTGTSRTMPAVISRLFLFSTIILLDLALITGGGFLFLLGVAYFGDQTAAGMTASELASHGITALVVAAVATVASLLFAWIENKV